MHGERWALYLVLSMSSLLSVSSVSQVVHFQITLFAELLQPLLTSIPRFLIASTPLCYR